MQERPRRFWMSRRAWLGASVLALLGLGSAGFAAAPRGWLGHHGHRFGGHFGHGGHDFSEEDVRYFVGRILREVDASEAQVTEVSAIASAALADFDALREAHRARRAAFAEALVAADRAALEELRSAELAAADAASQRAVRALADAAEVLTPAQRQQLAEAHARHHGG